MGDLIRFPMADEVLFGRIRTVSVKPDGRYHLYLAIESSKPLSAEWLKELLVFLIRETPEVPASEVGAAPLTNENESTVPCTILTADRDAQNANVFLCRLLCVEGDAPLQETFKPVDGCVPVKEVKFMVRSKIGTFQNATRIGFVNRAMRVSGSDD